MRTSSMSVSIPDMQLILPRPAHGLGLPHATGRAWIYRGKSTRQFTPTTPPRCDAVMPCCGHIVIASPGDVVTVRPRDEVMV